MWDGDHPVWSSGAGMPIDDDATGGRMFLATGNNGPDDNTNYPPISSTTQFGESIIDFNLANGGLTLENSQVAVATLNPTKAFGPSVFGPLKFRVTLKGIASDWQPLTHLVRLPSLKELKCPATPDLACKLTGSNLFLIDSVAGEPGFSHPVTVPDGFLGSALPVPHPAGPLYLKLRDDPNSVNAARLTVQQLADPADDAGRSEARQSALRSVEAGVPPADAHRDP